MLVWKSDVVRTCSVCGKLTVRPEPPQVNSYGSQPRINIIRSVLSPRMRLLEFNSWLESRSVNNVPATVERETIQEVGDQLLTHLDALDLMERELDCPQRETLQFPESHLVGDGLVFCSDCANAAHASGNIQRCDACGELYLSDEISQFDNVKLCKNCDQTMLRCDECGEQILVAVHNFKTLNGSTYCYKCSHVLGIGHCAQCGEQGKGLKMCRGVQYCENCVPDSYYIKDFMYKPTPKFHGKNSAKVKTPMIGLEVELESRDEEYDRSEHSGLLDKIPPMWYVKHDGSLANGLEFVSHPMSIRFIRNHPEVIDGLYSVVRKLNFGGRSSCGTHIHISNLWLGTETKYKMLGFFEKFHHELAAVGNRHNSRGAMRAMETYAKKWCGGIKCYNPDITDYRAWSDNFNRYYSINFSNEKTTEIRLWGAAGNADTLRYYIDLTYAICLFCKNNTLDEILNSNFSDLYKYLPKDAVAKISAILSV
jgi:hypothetical protein